MESYRDVSELSHAVACAAQMRLSEFTIRYARQWGACWVFVLLCQQLQLEPFWRERLPPSRDGTLWYHLLMVLCAYQLIDPGSQWRLHREWYARSAMGGLLDEDFGLLAKDNLYRYLDKSVQHKTELFRFLRQPWKDLFGVTFDVLLYDLTSTCFESEPPSDPEDKRHFGHSQDKRSDCAQMVIALVVTPKGRLSELEAALLPLRWRQVRPQLQVKLLAQDQELYVLVHTQARVSNERAVRRRKLKALWVRLQ